MKPSSLWHLLLLPKLRQGPHQKARSQWLAGADACASFARQIPPPLLEAGARAGKARSVLVTWGPGSPGVITFRLWSAER